MTFLTIADHPRRRNNIPYTDMAHFKYTPLDPFNNEIRLLFPLQNDPTASREAEATNQRAVEADDIDCPTMKPDLSMHFELRAVSLDDEPEYTALSYVWGDPSAPQQIIVNECSFSITNNLSLALQHIQYSSIQPAIWIDAICIDQSNNEEKNDQVPKMSRVFSKARKVLVWLGSGDAANDQAMSILYEAAKIFFGRLKRPVQHFCDNHNNFHWELRFLKHSSCEMLDALKEAVDIVSSKDSISSRCSFSFGDFVHWRQESIIACHWWYRVWTVQEYILASHRVFQIGLHTIDSDILTYLTEVGQCISWDAGIEPADLNKVFHLEFANTMPWLGSQKRNFFKILVEAYCGRKIPLRSSDNRDRIFALSALVEDDFKRLNISIDYDHSSSRVFADVARRIIESGDMEVLSLCRRTAPTGLPSCLETPRDNFKLPSWAPDWSNHLTEPHFWFVKGKHTFFNAAGCTACEISFHSCREESTVVMAAIGVLVDQVFVVRDNNCRGKHIDISNFKELYQLQGDVKEFMRISRGLTPTIYSNAQRRDAVWRIPIWDNACNYSNIRQRAIQKSRHDMKLWYHLGLASQNFDDLEAQRDLRYKTPGPGYMQRFMGCVREFWLEIKTQHHMARYLMSSDRLIGVCSQYLRAVAYMNLQFKWLQTWLNFERINQQSILRASSYARVMSEGNPTRLFVTEQGYVGYGPDTTEQGDIVCVLHGSNIPHVLRKRKNGQRGYELIGDAFVYGGMDGELMEGRERVEFEIF